MTKIGAVIMASGFSKRFGQKNKLLVPIEGMSLIERVLYEVLESDLFLSVVVVTQYQEIEALYKKNKKITLVKNTAPEEGISTTIQLGIEAMPKVDAYMFIQGDQIGLTRKNIEKIVQTFKQNKNKIIVPTYDGDYGSPKLFPSIYRDQLMALKGDVGGKQLLNRYSDELLTIGLEKEGNLDIDTEECYKKIRGMFDEVKKIL